FSTTLFPPSWSIIGVVVATTTCPTFELPLGTSGFARVVQVPPGTSLSPRLSIQRWPGNQLRISWPTVYTGFTLQSATSLAGPWTNVALPVVIEGPDFVVYDTIGPVPRFYRLFK